MEKVRLTPEEITTAENKGFVYLKGEVAKGETYHRDKLVATVEEFVAKAQLKKVVKWLLELPTDGWDKWHFYHKDLAEILLKELRE